MSEKDRMDLALVMIKRISALREAICQMMQIVDSVGGNELEEAWFIGEQALKEDLINGRCD